ncbi:MAG: hypothetical protein P4L35_18990 [Ignavibacteriaceae bacterium]|nr:hypothetical protein [Ignavibacteriaceae bacterium]
MKKVILIYSILIISILVIQFGCKDSITASDVDSRVMPQSNISFTVDLAPVFQLKCSNSGCHDDGTMAGGLSLTTCVNAKSDPGVIAPFSSKTSRIVWAIEGQAGIQPMPPVGVNKPFTSEQDRGLKKWIDEGAKCN